VDCGLATRASIPGFCIFSEQYIKNESGDEESAATILRALELGVNFFDTADAYGIGHNEQLIGKTIGGRRDEVFLATKFAYMRTADDPSSWMISGRPEYVQSACDASLRRLGVEHMTQYGTTPSWLTETMYGRSIPL
jgi:aryl-alcohol dehydrogenase-like predicted oxidoreductase